MVSDNSNDNCEVRTKVSSLDFHSSNRGSILLPRTKAFYYMNVNSHG